MRFDSVGTSIRVPSDAAAWPIHGVICPLRPELERRIKERGGDLAPMMEAAE